MIQKYVLFDVTLWVFTRNYVFYIENIKFKTTRIGVKYFVHMLNRRNIFDYFTRSSKKQPLDKFWLKISMRYFRYCLIVISHAIRIRRMPKYDEETNKWVYAV